MKFLQKILFVLATSINMWPCASLGQFINMTDAIGNHFVSVTTAFGSGISFCDFDNDGLDDLTIGLGMNAPKFFKNVDGSFVPVEFNIVTATSANVVMVLWADYDNDGDKDLLITKNAGAIELWQNDGDFNFTNVAVNAGIVTGSYFHAGAAFADYNHDGCLDLYITKYYDQANLQSSENHTNILYKNNCDGTFTDVTEEAGVFLLPSLTFQPVFFDYNKDGWEDLYLINEFGHYQNHLFKNNGDGTFSDVSEETGAGVNIEAMSGTIGDFNNNQHLDIFVTNRPSTGGNNLLVDQGNGTFLNLAEEFGLGINYTSWGALWLDYNNNGWQDLFVSIPAVGTSGQMGNQFYINNQGNSFSEGRDQLGFSDDFAPTYVCARGDFNNDGFYDLVHSSLYNDPVNLYENLGGDHNFITVELEGTLSNRDGIGSWIYCYADTHNAVHYTMCGENLIGQNSRKMIFGLGEINHVDSLVIEWNSGTREVYIQPEINTYHPLIEGASFTQPFSLLTTGNLQLCPGESVTLDTGTHSSYLWNTGDTTQTITVSQSGIYYAEAWNEFGLKAHSDTLEVVVVPEAEVQFTVQHVSCAGAQDGSVAVQISTGPVQEITWNNGGIDTQIQQLGSGIYSFTALDSAGCMVNGEVSLNEPSPLLAQALTTDVLCFGDSSGTAQINVIGGTPPLSTEWNGENPQNLSAGNYDALVTDQNGCEFLLSYTINQPDSLWVNLFIIHATQNNDGEAYALVQGGTAPFSLLWSTGDSDIPQIGDLVPGEYTLQVTDANGCIHLAYFTIDQVSGINANYDDGLRVFPNPSGGDGVLEGCLPGADLELYDMFGRRVFSQRTETCPVLLHLSHLPAGQYVLCVLHGSQNTSLRLVLLR